MDRPYASIGFNYDSPLIQAAFPLLEAGEVQAIEWSFDTLYQHQNIPDWFPELIRDFGKAGRLIGHGIFFSIFRAALSADQQAWLADLEKKAKMFQFDHVSEHFGFLTGPDFHRGAPLGVPFTAQMLAIGQDRLLRIAQACQCPVGLENLAFAYSAAAAREHGQFLAQLLAPVNGFMILDLHNIYCQLHNFDLDFAELIQLYPLDRVREIHISGGSWDEPGTSGPQKVRRDTHDKGVPHTVFALLEAALPICPNLKFVVLEQIGPSLTTTKSQERYREDFRTMRQILAAQAHPNPGKNLFLPPQNLPSSPPIMSPLLLAQQLTLSEILETATDGTAARAALQSSSLAGTAWKFENWPPHMLETAVRIAQKWKHGFR